MVPFSILLLFLCFFASYSLLPSVSVCLSAVFSLTGGDEAVLVPMLQPLFRQFNVTAYFHGHQHVTSVSRKLCPIFASSTALALVLTDAHVA